MVAARAQGAAWKLVAKARDGLEYNDHLTGAGAEIFAQACRLGHEGIVAKRRDLPYEPAARSAG
jgi:ATP-dependent DNA ligase